MKENFSYTYNALDQEEIQRIRNKYLPKEEDKLTTLRKTDALPAKKATCISLIIGIVGTLIMGSGMSLIMTDLFKTLNLDFSLAVIIGVCAGVVGMVMLALSYPLYKSVLKKERKKIAPEILRLTEELMK